MVDCTKTENTIELSCGVCGRKKWGFKQGDGFFGWSQIHGVSLNGQPFPYLCVDHTREVMDYVDSLCSSENALGD